LLSESEDSNMSSVQKFLLSNPVSKKLYDRALSSMPSGNTRDVVFYRPYPLYAVRGKGSHIWDVDGNERIDYMLNASVLLLGHAHPKVVSAIKEQLENGTVLGTPTELEIRLAEKIVQMVPCAKKVKFVVTGSEACMNVLRVARAYTGKSKVIIFEGHFHGTADPTVSRSGTFHSQGILEDTYTKQIIVPFNDTQKVEKAIKENKDELAACILEPVLGSGGGIPGTTEFLKTCREMTERNNVLLVFDEVQTGFRLAAGGAQERFGIVPDLVALGKGVAGGMPGSAFGGREDIMDEVCSFPDSANPVRTGARVPLGGTFNAHPLAMAAGLAHLNELRKPVFDHIDKAAATIRDGFSRIASDLGMRLQMTGIGSFFHVYFTKYPIKNYQDTRYADPRLLWYLDVSLLNKGVYLSPAHCSYTCMPLSDEDVKHTLEAIEQSLMDMKPIVKEIAPDLIT